MTDRMAGDGARSWETVLSPGPRQEASAYYENRFGKHTTVVLRLILGFAIIALARLALAGQAPEPSRNRSSDKTFSVQADLTRSEAFALMGTHPLAHALFNSDSFLEQQRQQITHYFLRQIAATPAKRDQLWQPEFSSIENYEASIKEHRNHLRKMLGLFRPGLGTPQIKTLQQSEDLKVEDVTVPIDGKFCARALLFLPHSIAAGAAVIAISSASESRENFAGIVQGMNPAEWLQSFLARHIAVAVPMTVERRADHPLCKTAGGKDRRRVLWRAGFIVGRTLVGVEVQEVLALQEFLSRLPSIDPNRIGVFGERQGGMTALYAGAIDTRLAAVGVVNYFQQRENCWMKPVDQVLYGQLNEFGDAEVAALIAPRPLLIVTAQGGPPVASVEAEAGRAMRFYHGMRLPNKLMVSQVAANGSEVAGLKLARLLGARHMQNPPTITVRISRSEVDAFRNEHFEALYDYLRRLDAASDNARRDHWHLDSTPARDRLDKAAQLRNSLARLIGTIPSDQIPMNPRTVGRDYGCRDMRYCYETVAPDFHGYSPNSLGIIPYVKRSLDSDHKSFIQGSFYLSQESTIFTGMAFKLARVGNPGDLIVKFGSRDGAQDLGEARIRGDDVYPRFDLWYAAVLNKPIRLDPLRVYFFEIEAESGLAPENCFEVFGPRPLAGQDYPQDFGLSFRVLSHGRDRLPSMPTD